MADITGSGPEGRAQDNQDDGAEGDAGAVPEPLQDEGSRHDVDHVEFGQQAGGFAGNAEVEVETAKHLEREKTTHPAMNTAQARSGLARANLSLTMTKATATTTATQNNQRVPCSETYFRFSCGTWK